MRTLEFVLQQIHTALMALTGYHSNDIVANPPEEPVGGWRRLQKRCDPTDWRKNTKPSADDHFSWTVLFWKFKRGSKRWESYVSNVKKDKEDDENMLAGPDSLVPEELEKHLILHSNRLQTLEDARLEIVTYV